MDRRAFVRRLPALAALPRAASLAGGRTAGGDYDPDALVRRLRRDGVWSARLDDPAYGGRGDGTTLNDEPLLQALADMPTEGGTLVIPPAGAWLFDAVDLARVGRRQIRLFVTGARVLKAPRTADHMFRDVHGTSNGLTVVGGTFDLSRGAFQKGQTVSAFFLVRADDVSFVDVTVRDGIEEGLKLYTPRGLRVLGGAYERLVNNGVQIHAPADDGFEGDAPERDTEDVSVDGVAFRSIDDGLHGMEGQGVSVSGASARVAARRVRVAQCTFERCVRGAWAEFNQPGRPGLDIRFDENRVLSAECHGLGLVGVRGGGLKGNHVLDTGRVVPGRRGVAASEIAGLVLSGSHETPGEDLVVEDNEVVDARTGAGPRMQYGILVRQQKRLVERRNVVRGATVQEIRVER